MAESRADNGVIEGNAGSRAPASASGARTVNDHVRQPSQHDTYEERARRIAEWRTRLLGAVRLEDRLQLLCELGLTDAETARAIPDGNARSVRRWRLEGVARGRLATRWAPIDDLCAIVGFLLSDGTYDESGVVAWLRSRRPELGHERPLDVLGAGDFSAVFDAGRRDAGSGCRGTTGRGTDARPCSDRW